jgi:hypothetical protein
MFGGGWRSFVGLIGNAIVTVWDGVGAEEILRSEAVGVVTPRLKGCATSFQADIAHAATIE